jgi:cytochrome c553
MSERSPYWRRRLKSGAMGVLGAAAMFAAWVYGSTEARLRAHYDVDVAPIAVPKDYETLARGSHVVHALAKCTGCHGEDLGGRVLSESPMLGRLSAPNLTSPPLRDRSNEDLVRALTHGVAPDGRPLVLMPAHEIGELSDADIAAVVAYLRTVPPVFREVRPLHVGPVLRVLLALHKAELIPAERIDHAKARPAAAPDESSSAFGEYLAKSGGCFGCHGATLAGGAIPGMPPGTPRAADIRPEALASWSFDDFDRALRTGTRPDGRRLAELMPWRAMSNMTDSEMRALYAYLTKRSAAKSASNP